MPLSVTERYDSLSSAQEVTQIKVLHDEVGRFAFPRMPNATYDHTLDFSELLSENHYDSTLRRNLLDASNGIASMLFPVGDQGFSLRPGRVPRPLLERLGLSHSDQLHKDDSVRKYYAEVNEELVYRLRSNSNFLNTTGEALLEWWSFGTGGMRRSWSERKGRLHFRNMPVNTYCLEQDAEGDICGTYSALSYTARQAADEWGKESLPMEIQERLREDRKDETDEYVLGVREMLEFDSAEDRKAAKGRRWLMKVEHRKTKHVVLSGGFHENPFSFSRWATITGIPYGFAPTWLIIPEFRRLYRLQELADNLGLASLAPPVKASGRLKGRINRGPLGVTYVEDDDILEPMSLSGPEYKIGLDRIADAKNDIGAVLYMDFFRLFTGKDDPPETATLARLMDAERAGQIGTPYQRLVQEFFGPQILGAHSTLERLDIMPSPPEQLVIGEDADTGRPRIPEPEVLFENRLVNALKAVQNVAFAEWMQLVGTTLAELDRGTLLANLDMEEILRDSYRIAVKAEDHLRPIFEAAERREEIDKTQANVLQMQQMEQAAGAASKLR